MNPEEAYQQLLTLLDSAKTIEEKMKSYFDYSPFDYLAGKIKGEIRDIRTKLISSTVKKYRQQYTPNFKPDVDFKKKMDEAVGELGFEEVLIHRWFEGQAQDKETLRARSLEQLLNKARRLVPYTSDGQAHGPLKDWRKLVSGRIVTLRAYSWGAYNSISYHLNADGDFNALEKIVDLVTLHAGDPSTISGGSWISHHITHTRQDPEKFYGRHTATQPTVQAFQFFKNQKLKIWFKRAEQAEAVAKTLTTGSLVRPRAPTLLAVAS